MRMRTTTGTTAAICTLLLLAMPTMALADEGHTHPVAGGGTPPAVVPAETPAPGAQPAAPAAQATTPAADTAGVGVVDTTTPKPAAAAATTDRAATTPAVSPVASGGGSHAAHDDSTPAPAAAGGGDATTPAAPAATPTGELPFTGVEDNILLISLAGMFVPIGVLLYCAARRGDLRRLREHLSRPRFEWTPY